MSNSLLKQLGLRAMQVAKEAEVPEVPAAPAAVTGPDETILATAEQAHEANRAYCAEQGDESQLPWAEADQSIRDSAIRGVQAIMDGKVFNSKDSHDRWMEGKIAEGWTLGDVKDETAKTHPSLVAYDQLPEHERMKDDIFVNTVKTALGMGEKVTEAEVATVAAECMALVHSMETLEAMASTLETAPPEQLNETNAALINTVVQGVVGEDEGERMMPSVESYSLGSKRVLAAYAKEGIMDKMKDVTKRIIEKIIELIQKFWQWLTMNHKRVRSNLLSSFDKSASKKHVELKMQNKWQRLTKTSTVSSQGMIEIASELDELCRQANEFVTTGFKETAKVTQPNMAKPTSMAGIFEHCFSNHSYDKATSTVTLYENINKRNLTVKFSDTYLANSELPNSPSFTTALTKAESVGNYDDVFTIDNNEIHAIHQSALTLLDNSEKEFAKINRLQGSLKQLAKVGGSFGSEPGVEQKSVFASYNQALIAFIDGIYTEALRHGVAVTSLCKAFGESNETIPGSQNSKGYAF